QRVGLLGAGENLDEGLDRLPALRVGDADHCARRHTLYLDDLRFDLGRTDAITGGLDDVVSAALKVEVALVVAVAHVARHAPLALHFLLRGLRVLPVLAHHHRALLADGDLADFPVLDRLAFWIDDLHAVSGKRFA